MFKGCEILLRKSCKDLMNGVYKTKRPTRSTKLSNNLTFSHTFLIQNQFMLQMFLLANNPSVPFLKNCSICMWRFQKHSSQDEGMAQFSFLRQQNSLGRNKVRPLIHKMLGSEILSLMVQMSLSVYGFQHNFLTLLHMCCW